MIPGLKNAIVDLLVEANVKERAIPTYQLELVWEKLPESDGLRKLFLDWFTYQNIGQDFFSLSDDHDYPHSFLIEPMHRVIRPPDRPKFRSKKEWLQRNVFTTTILVLMQEATSYSTSPRRAGDDLVSRDLSHKDICEWILKSDAYCKSIAYLWINST
jgi:predicted phosphoadenosine phosphosulfate sulfurtransferase